jgi:teichuronic acid biosynthesis glycosyltransferase TuaC
MGADDVRSVLSAGVVGLKAVRILTFTTLYPNAAQPRHGLFVEQRLRQVLRTGELAACVVAPVPWFPFRSPRFGLYAQYAAVPACEQRYGIEVQHPRYPVLPKIGMSVTPWFLARAGIAAAHRLAEGFDLVDAHYFYPDGVAAALFAQRLGKPVVITARGSDINLLPRFALPRRWIRWAAARAAAIISVSRALKDELVSLGVAASKITVLRNGVDLDFFRPLERDSARAQLGWRGRTLLCVGNLLHSKGQDIAIETLRHLPDTSLVIIGDGPDRQALESLARSIGVADRVSFVGGLAQEDLVRYYSAADALLLPSEREGWPNVLLEAIACGTPVVTSRVGGSVEIVRAEEAGTLVTERSAVAFADALRRLFVRPPNRAATRRYAEGFSWEEIAFAQRELYRAVLRQVA